jgi:predicted nucleic-acid-binding Zn-ribbon protein
MSLFGKSEPTEVDVNGKALRCVVCANTTFHKREAQLHGAVATFFDLEWSSPTANCFVCSSCGYVHWFL